MGIKDFLLSFTSAKGKNIIWSGKSTLPAHKSLIANYILNREYENAFYVSLVRVFQVDAIRFWEGKDLDFEIFG